MQPYKKAAVGVKGGEKIGNKLAAVVYYGKCQGRVLLSNNN